MFGIKCRFFALFSANFNVTDFTSCYFEIFLTLTPNASAGFFTIIWSSSSLVKPSLIKSSEKELKRSE